MRRSALVGIGGGRTLDVAKLAATLKLRHNARVALITIDTYRIAAIDQLKVLGEQVGVEVYSEIENKNPVDIAKNAISKAKQVGYDVVIIDTAGRLSVDEQMMQEIADVKKAVNPGEILFVVDSMTGQDAVNTAKAFNDRLDFSGVVLTKLDGDTRGGAALSIKSVVNKPIKFVSMGEKMEALDVFHPDRMASRILGMGDVVTLVEYGDYECPHCARAHRIIPIIQREKSMLRALELYDRAIALDPLFARALVARIQLRLGGTGLQHHRGDGVSHHVVELPGDARPFLGDRDPFTLRLVACQSLRPRSHLVAAGGPGADHPPDRPRRAEDHQIDQGEREQGGREPPGAHEIGGVTLLLVVIDIVWLRFRVRQAVRSRFPDESLKGITWYAISRAVNMRFLRLPKPQRKIGEALPQNYR